MKKNLKLSLAAAVLMPVFTLAETIVPLIAGGGTVTPESLVGNVIVSNNDTNLTVKYEIKNPYLEGLDPVHNDGTWRIITTHTHAGDSLDDFPLTAKGAPKIGGFTDNEGGSTVNLPIPANDDGTVTIGAHAEVEQMTAVADYIAMENNIKLPQEVNLTVAWGEETYFKAVVESNDALDGQYPHSWCIDPVSPIKVGTTYSTVWAVSSYDSNFTEYPSGGAYDDYIAKHIINAQDLDIVNYIVNRFDKDEYRDENGDTVHMCNIQQALWMVTNDIYVYGETQGYCPGWDLGTTDAIVADAQANGKGYKPGCGDDMVIVLIGDPTEGSTTEDIQTVIVHIPVPCKETWGEETAWGGNYEGTMTIDRFVPNNWAMHFEHTITDTQ